MNNGKKSKIGLIVKVSFVLISLLLISIEIYHQFDIKFDGIDYSTLIIGTRFGPASLDPVDSWDSASYNVLDQVIEGLYTNNLSDPNLKRINLLA